MRRPDRLDDWLAWLAPPTLALVVLAHRNDPALAMDLAPDTGVWIGIHVVLLAALVLLAAAVRHLLHGIDNTAAVVARALLPLALVTYAAFDSLVGLGTGVLVRHAGGLDDGAAALVEHWWTVPTPINAISAVAQVSWVIVIGAVAVARRLDGAPPALVPVLVAFAATFPFVHVRPIGLVPVALLLAALVISRRAGHPSTRPAPARPVPSA